MDMGKYTGLVNHQRIYLHEIIFMNLDHNKFTENMYEHTMQINHDEELSILR